MLRSSREEFFSTCSSQGTCPITEIWFQRTPESADDQTTVIEYAQGNYLGFKRSTLESSRFDDFISEAFVGPDQGCQSDSETLRILVDKQCDNRKSESGRQLLPLAQTELDLLRLSGVLKDVEKLPMMF